MHFFHFPVPLPSLFPLLFHLIQHQLIPAMAFLEIVLRSLHYSISNASFSASHNQKYEQLLIFLQKQPTTLGSFLLLILRFLLIIDLVKLPPLFIYPLLTQFAGTMHINMKLLVQFECAFNWSCLLLYSRFGNIKTIGNLNFSFLLKIGFILVETFY